MSDCVFCQKIHQETFEHEWNFAHVKVVGFEPLNPVVPGHMLFVPSLHSVNAADKTLWTGLTFECASKYAREQARPFNLITSAGTEATQSIFHLHVHYVPRAEGDGLHLPWTGQKK